MHTVSAGQDTFHSLMSPLMSALVLLVATLLAAPRLPHAIAAAAPATANQTDAQLLLAFKESFDDSETVLGDWVEGTEPCSWWGVGCDAAGRVIEM